MIPGQCRIKRLNSSPLYKTAGFFILKKYRIFKAFKKIAPHTRKALLLYISYNPLSLTREAAYA